MKRSFIALSALVVLLAVRTDFAQQTKQSSLGDASNETKRLLDKWIAVCDRQEREHPWPEVIHGPELEQLLVRPDADLALFKFIEPSGRTLDPPQHNGAYWEARKELGKLNTQRTYDIFVARLKSKDMFVREEAILFLSLYSKRAESVPLVIEALQNDPEPQVRGRAADALGELKDPRAEAALIRAVEGKNHRVAVDAAGALAKMNSRAGVDPVVDLLARLKMDSEPSGYNALYYLIMNLHDYHRKKVIEAVLQRYSSTPAVTARDPDRRPRFADGMDGAIQREASIVMQHTFEATGQALGPQPDDYYEEWQDWWNRVEPLLTDDLKLKKALEDKPKQYADAEFGNDPNDIELHIAVDSLKVRFHDPIRLDLTFKNKSDRPYKVVLPKPPSGWMPTMAYGIRLTRGEDVLVNIEPSDHYLGSYSGPPQFETLAPHQEFHSSVCLQYFLDWQIKKKPLAEGIYEFKLTFDPGKYAGIHPQGVELVHRWEADSIKFMITGEERTDTKEILDVIAEKSGLPFFKNDLFSPNYQRREPAEHILYQYADKRLQADKSIPGRIHADPYLRD